jgi:oligoribonuclease NrnB/cAMP/cGMP phosphodiesterase (DHH superfamily)
MTSERFPRDTTDEKATVPPTEFFLPPETRREQAETRFRDLISGISRGEDALVITHNDADGLTSGAYMKDWYESVTTGDAVVYPTAYNGPCNLPTALEILNDTGEVIPKWVFVTDLGASLFEEALPQVNALYPDTDVAWIDHHQWTDEQLAELHTSAHGVIDDSKCATQLFVELRKGLHERLLPLKTSHIPDQQQELAAVVNDLDLWIKDDPRSDRIGIFAEYADNDEYMEAVLDGISLLETYDEELQAYEAENAALLDRAVNTASTTMINGIETAFAYGYGPSASVGNDLVEQYGADLAVVMRPNGRLSFYAHSDENDFTDCHLVAGELGGGGHPTAAGASLDLEEFDEFLTLWDKENEAFRGRIATAIQERGEA